MCSDCIPSRFVKISGNQKPEMTDAIKRLFKKANRLHKRASRTRSQIDIDKHRVARRIAKAAWKKSQFNYYYEINMKLQDPKTSPKCYWKLIKQELGRNKTFFPSTTSVWNKLPLIVKQSVSLNCFKSTLKRQHSAADSILPGVYNCFYEYHGSILAQLRLGLSNLKGDLFNFNLTDNPICPLCLGSFESRSHFFVNCTVLDVERRVLVGQISQFFPQFQQLSLIDKSIICTVGSPNLDFTTNFELLKCSVDYIRSSERFTPRYLTN